MKIPKIRSGLLTLLLATLVGVGLGVLTTASFNLTSSTKAEVFWKEGNSNPPSTRLPDFVDLVKRLKPAVVNISTTQVVKESPLAPFFRSPFEDFFGEDFFERFFGQRPREFKTQSLGSGFIISKEGYIVTNNHVVENAEEIVVILASGDEYPAKIIGKDKRTDIALIKIEPKGDLPVAVLGDSDALQVGEWVLAIGNPFGLGHTVTAGIVSAKGRVIGQGPYDDFIQTDASINPGNSGGPLFNTRGEVVGINTAIISGGQGIGFAIPINMAKWVVSQLKEKGKVVRGWLGVSIQEVTPELARSFGLKEKKGALVSSVFPGEPADRAGIKAGDVIIEFDGKEVKSYHDLPRMVASTPPGKKVDVKVIRNGKELTLHVVLGELKEKERAELKGERGRRLGIMVREITPDLAERLGLEDTEGVIVIRVVPGSPADRGGLRRGDVIKEINRTPVRDMDDYRRLMGKVKKGDVVLFRVIRGGSSLYVAVRVE